MTRRGTFGFRWSSGLSGRALLLFVSDAHAQVVLGVLFPVARSELHPHHERRGTACGKTHYYYHHDLGRVAHQRRLRKEFRSETRSEFFLLNSRVGTDVSCGHSFRTYGILSFPRSTVTACSNTQYRFESRRFLLFRYCFRS